MMRAGSALRLVPLLGMLLSHAASCHDAADVPHLWSASCGYCHGAGVAPQLQGLRLPAALIIHAMRNGVTGMPQFHPSEIDDAALARFADWLSRSPTPAPASAPAPAADPKAR